MQGAFLMADGVYPISMIYLGCVQAMCQINLKEQEEAIQTVSQAWERARFDKFMEPFIEYHGLLHGVLEVCIRKKRVGYAFAGWYTDAKCTKEYKANMPDQDPNAKTQTADDTGEKPTGIRIPGYPTITIEADKKTCR